MIYLHIGRHKTGTTAIQRFLAGNRDRLAKAGLLYPPTPRDLPHHHGVVLALWEEFGRSPVPPVPRLDSIERADLTDFGKRLRDAPIAIVSSEMFQGMNPQLLTGLFPPDETRVVVYLREQLDYLASAYAQVVRGRWVTDSFDTFAGARAQYNYRTFLERWAAVYGDERMIVRLYDREAFVGGNVVMDFLAALELHDLTSPATTTSDANVSLSALLVVMKRLVNRVLEAKEDDRRHLHQVFGRLAARDRSGQRRVAVEPSTADAIREEFKEGNTYVSRRYFDSESDVFRYKHFDSEYSFIDAEVADVLDLLAQEDSAVHASLLQAVQDDGFVAGLSAEEQSLSHVLRTVGAEAQHAAGLREAFLNARWWGGGSFRRQRRPG